MDGYQFRYLWMPFKWLGRKLKTIPGKIAGPLLGLLFIAGLFCFLFEEKIPKQLDDLLHQFFAFIGMILILRSFAVRKRAFHAWLLIIASQFFIVLSIAFLNDSYEYQEILIYISGLFVAGVTGFICLSTLKKLEKHIDLNNFNGHIYEHPKIAFIFLVACLGFVGLPFTPSFIGMDLMFTHIHQHEYLLVTFISISFLFLEIAVLRIYARLFLGPHKKNYHPVSYRSS